MSSQYLKKFAELGIAQPQPVLLLRGFGAKIRFSSERKWERIMGWVSMHFIHG